jgi:hypothetical protein
VVNEAGSDQYLTGLGQIKLKLMIELQSWRPSPNHLISL